MRKCFYLALIFFISACDYKVLWEDEFFAVYWIDDPKYVGLGRKIDGGYLGMASPPFSIGSNENYLVLKTHPYYNYYDKRIEDKNNQSLFKRFGPFSKEEFLIVKEKLSLPDFEIEY